MESINNLGIILSLITFFAGLVIGVVLVLVTLFVNSKMKSTNVGTSVTEEAVSQHISEMKGQLQAVTSLLSENSQKFGEINTQLEHTAKSTQRLQETTNKLETTLSNSSIRGQWGEKAAKDILTHLGFIEGINFHIQKTQAIDNSRPDFTLLLPQDLKLNIDAKFPFDNYNRYCECHSDLERQQYKNKFLTDVKKRIDEIKKYVSPEESTLDYVIMFIPVESVYSFVLEHDKGFFDKALENKVVVCSPLTLYAVLTVIKQAIDSFNLGKENSKILSSINAFKKQWEEYVKSFDKLGRKIDEVKAEYNRLVTTRSNKLEAQIKKIKTIKSNEKPDDYLLIESETQLEVQVEKVIDKTE